MSDDTQKPVRPAPEPPQQEPSNVVSIVPPVSEQTQLLRVMVEAMAEMRLDIASVSRSVQAVYRLIGEWRALCTQMDRIGTWDER